MVKGKKKNLLHNPMFWIGIMSLIGLITGIIIWAVSGSSGGGGGGGGSCNLPNTCTPFKNTNDLSFAGETSPKIATWAWNTLVVGGYLGYGIFANNTGGYTWDTNDDAVDKVMATKWDNQIPYSLADNAKYDNVMTKLNAVDSGSQFWDFVSKDGSYYTNNKRRSMDAIKLAFDDPKLTTTTMSTRYKNIINNLVKDGLEVAILISGKPAQDGSRYHGTSFANMMTQLDNATDWINTNNLGDKVYISLDIEPYDIALDMPNNTGIIAWYSKFLPAIACHIYKHKGKDVYYGLAINKNPYLSQKAHDALQKLLTANWTVNGQPRGFRVLELMYWFTAGDFLKSSAMGYNTSHLVNQLNTTWSNGTATPISDAKACGVFLQFGMETTGEIDLLNYVLKQPTGGSGPDVPCPSPYIADCQRAMQNSSIEFANPCIGYVCENSKFKTQAKDNKSPEWYNALQFQGKSRDYIANYGFPFIPGCPVGNTETAKFPHEFWQCNHEGNCYHEAGGSEYGNCQSAPKYIPSAINHKSCEFLDMESWLLGGGAKNMEKWLHSSTQGGAYLQNVLQAANGDLSLLYRIPFCVEDLTGYAANLYHAKNDKWPLSGKYNNKGAYTPGICTEGANIDDKKYNFPASYNIPCLGQTVLDYADGKFTPKWIAGTLNTTGPGGTPSCPLDLYFNNENVKT